MRNCAIRAITLLLATSTIACVGDEGRGADGLTGGSATKADELDDAGGEAAQEGTPPGCHAEELAALGYTIEWHEAQVRSQRIAPAETIIIHETQGDTFDGAVTSLTGSRASVHYVVGPAGEIACLVPTDEQAEQVSNDEFDEGSLGIELVGLSNRDDTTEAQMAALAALVSVLAGEHAIPLDRDHVIGHIEVPKEDGTVGCGGDSGHFDPGIDFDYADLMRRLGVPAEHAVAEQPMAWAVLSGEERIVLAPGERRTLTFELVNTGMGTWEADLVKLIASDLTTRGFRAPTWQTGEVILPNVDEGTTGECFGPLREVTLSLDVQAPLEPDCGETEQPCVRTLTFYPYAQVRPYAWDYYTDVTLTVEVEIAQ